jgi:hypothetical protein
MSNEVVSCLDDAIERAREWLDSLDPESREESIEARFYEIAAFLYHVPARQAHQYAWELLHTVMRLPMVTLATAAMDPGDAEMCVEMRVGCKGMVAPALGLIIDKLRSTADQFEKMHQQVPAQGQVVVTYDSTAKPVEPS